MDDYEVDEVGNGIILSDACKEIEQLKAENEQLRNIADGNARVVDKLKNIIVSMEENSYDRQVADAQARAAQEQNSEAETK